MNLNVAEFKARRQKLMALMGNGIAIIPTANEVIRNRDSHYPFRFDSYFYYLTGFKEPESLLVLLAGDAAKGEPAQSILFCRDKDIEREIWDGFRFGADAAREAFGFDAAYSINDLDAVLLKLLGNQPKLFYSLGESSAFDSRVTGWINSLRAHPLKVPIKFRKIIRYWQARFFGRLPISHGPINHLLFIPTNIGIF